ncbi:MAG: MATE family efflux transporter [Pseudomonadota bacterium]
MPDDAARPAASGGGATAAAPAKFVEGDLMRHVVVMTLSASVGLMAIFLVDLADLFFISLLGQAELAAAVGYAAAIVFVNISVGIGLAIAAGALVGRALGAGEQERARRYATHVSVVAVAVAVVVSALMMAAIPQLVALLGARGETALLTERYLSIVLPSLPFMVMMMCAGAVLRAHGDARGAMNVTLLAALANGVLDPLLIFSLDLGAAAGGAPGVWRIGADLGLDGAAAASVAARVVGCAYGLALVVRRHRGFAPLRRDALARDVREISGLAGPAMLTNVATPLGAAFMTRLVAEYGDAAVAGFAIIGRLTPVAFGAVFALSGAIGPIVAQNCGAVRYDRVRETLTAALKFLLVYVAAVTIALLAARGAIADAFGAEGAARDLVYLFCGPLALFFFFNGVLFIANAAFNNLQRPFLSTALNWGRHTIGTAPPALLGASLGGAEGALLGQAVGGLAFAALAIWRAYRLVDQRAAGDGPRAEPERIYWRRPSWPFTSMRD